MKNFKTFFEVKTGSRLKEIIQGVLSSVTLKFFLLGQPVANIFSQPPPSSTIKKLPMTLSVYLETVFSDVS